MKPILYPKNATKAQITSSKNGIGRLDPISCVVKEELNGSYELEMVYSVSGAHFDEIGINSVIVCVHEDSADLQPFEVYSIKKLIGGRVEVFAHHISYRLNNFVTMPFSVASGANACENTLAGLKSNAAVADDVTDYTFWTDVHTLGAYNQTVPATIRSRLGGVEGSVLDQFGGEYEWDKFDVKLHLQRGNPITGITLKYGKNITDIDQETLLSNVVTGVVPFWTKQDGDDTLYYNLPERVVYSQYASNYPYHLTQPLDLSDQWDSQPSESTLRSAAQAYVNSEKLGIPKVSIKISFVELWQTEEYKDIAPLERVHMGDTVWVYFEPLGIEAQARVVATEYNVLLERYNQMQIGSVRSTLAQTLNDQRAETIEAVSGAKQYANEAANNATKWLTATGGHVIAVKNENDGHWEKLAVCNMTDPYANTAKGILMTQNGFGFFYNGMNSTFFQAWTIDGHLVIGVPKSGGTITRYAPALEIYNGGQNPIGKWDKDGILVKSGVIRLGDKTSLTDGNNGVYVSSDGIALGPNNTFKVLNTGVLTMKNGTIQLGDKTSLIDANEGLYLNSSGIALGKSSIFKVDNKGALTAKSGTVGGFTIDEHFIRHGETNGTGAGDVCYGNDNFTRSINNTSRANLRLAIGSKFGVQSDGTIYASGADMSGGSITGANITSRNGQSYVNMDGGKVYIYNHGAGGAYIEIQRNDGVHVWIHEDCVTYNNGSAHMTATWEDIIEAANNRSS